MSISVTLFDYSSASEGACEIQTGMTNQVLRHFWNYEPFLKRLIAAKKHRTIPSRRHDGVSVCFFPSMLVKTLVFFLFTNLPPKCSMYGIVTYIYHEFQWAYKCKYTIRGASRPHFVFSPVFPGGTKPYPLPTCRCSSASVCVNWPPLTRVHMKSNAGTNSAFQKIGEKRGGTMVKLTQPMAILYLNSLGLYYFCMKH